MNHVAAISHACRQMLLSLKNATAKKIDCSVFVEDKNSCSIFPHNYTQNRNGVLICVGRAGRKHKHIPQLHQTEKTTENAPSLPEGFALCVNETRLGASVYNRLPNACCTAVNGSVFTKCTTDQPSSEW
jgi:hypothetical protein